MVLLETDPTTGHPLRSPSRAAERRTRPLHRPPVVLRAFAALLGVAVLAFNAALMTSDRAPGVLRALGGDLATRLSARLDAGARVPLAVEQRLPESDFMVHVGVWAVALVLVGVAVWTWRGLVVAAIGVFAASVFIEAAQGQYTSTREVEVDDLVANGVGVLLGVVAVGLLYSLWSMVAIVVDRLRS